MSIADFSALGARLDRAAPRTAVVAAAHDSHTLEAVFAAQRDGLISPILVGRKAEISMLARRLELCATVPLKSLHLLPTLHHRAPMEPPLCAQSRVLEF